MMKRLQKVIPRAFHSLLFLLILLVLIPSGSGHATKEAIDLTELTLEQLMDIKITSVSRKPEVLSEAASAVYVITQEDIRRSGATSIPEALRMVPGLEVAQINASKWAVSARGFSDLFAKYLKVLIDGRNVYSPLFGRVNWDEVDTMLEDIERIEVIRGPGATMWGSNAVNGVINIITKNAKKTQGGLLSIGGGNSIEGFGNIRYGGKLNDDVYYRTYMKYSNYDSLPDKQGGNVSDRWDMGRGGFRIDWDKSQEDSITILGEVINADLNETLTATTLIPPFSKTFNDSLDLTGGNIIANWIHKFSDTNAMQCQFYYDRVVRDDALFREELNTFDIELHQQFTVGRRQEIVWGFEYTFTSEELRNSFTVSHDPDYRDLNIASIFIQDEIAFFKNYLYLILGSKFEYNDFTAFEVQPSCRLLWKPHNNHSLWTAVSKAVKIPNRGNIDGTINVAVFPAGFTLGNIAIFPNKDYDSEEVIAYELGYRFYPKGSFFVDMACFYNDYQDLLDLERGRIYFESHPLPRFIIPLRQENEMYGHTYGTEISLTWNATNDWRIITGYTWFQMRLDSHLETKRYKDRERSDPENQFHLRSYLNLPRSIEFDSALYYVDHIGRWDIPSYIRLDARLGWRPKENFSLIFAIQNWLDNHHPEYDTEQGYGGTEAERRFYVKMMWQF